MAKKPGTYLHVECIAEYTTLANTVIKVGQRGRVLGQCGIFAAPDRKPSEKIWLVEWYTNPSPKTRRGRTFQAIPANHLIILGRIN